MNEILKEAKQHIRKFVRMHWSDELLAQAYAHNQAGNMSYWSPCSCFLGVTLSKVLHTRKGLSCSQLHYFSAKALQGATAAEWGYCYLSGSTNSAPLRQYRLSAILRAEMRIRDRVRQQAREMEQVEVAYVERA